MPSAPRSDHRLPAVALLTLAVSLAAGCVPHRVYNDEPSEYLLTVPAADGSAAAADLAIIEFDDHGVLWEPRQLEDTIRMIRRRNAEAQHGTLVVLYIHGWKNNADPADTDGALSRFRDTVGRNAAAQRGAGPVAADRVVGVFLGWRGASSRLPFYEQATFWGRRHAAERVASLNMRETLFRLMHATKERPGSKCFVVGHSMGGLIVGRTMAPSLTTLLLANADAGTRLPADLILLQNPALDALASWQFIDFLKRAGARIELRSADGSRREALGPIIASITSEADTATSASYPFGRSLGSLFTAFRRGEPGPRPSQRYLATHAEGHVDYLISHRAWVEDGEIVLERVPGAFNDTPFWVIQVSREISRDHGDVRNAVYSRLVEKLLDLNEVYRTDLQTWLLADHPFDDQAASAGR